MSGSGNLAFIHIGEKTPESKRESERIERVLSQRNCNLRSISATIASLIHPEWRRIQEARRLALNHLGVEEAPCSGARVLVPSASLGTPGAVPRLVSWPAID